jgi:hypothetical protein
VDATVRARFNLVRESDSRIVLCGKPDSKGNKTCGGMFGIQLERYHDRPAFMRMKGIFRRDVRGMYQPTIRARDQRAEGQPVRLRRSHVQNEDDYPRRLFGSLPPVDIGPQGEVIGAIVYDFPVMAVCPRCLTLNEIEHFSHIV